MLHRVIGRLGEVSGEVIVVGPASGPAPKVPAGRAVRVVRDALEAQGPLVGLASGLAAVQGPLALVAAGDMPELQVPVLRELLRLAGAEGAEAVALEQGGGVRPLPCVLAVEPASRAAARLVDAGERRLRALLGVLRLVVVPEDRWLRLDPERRTLHDVDVPEDLPG